MSFPSIPVIDVDPLLEPSNAEQIMKCVSELDMACSEVGFFTVKNHGLPRKVQYFCYRPCQRQRLGTTDIICTAMT